MPARRLTGIFFLVLPPELDVALVLFGDRMALLLASGQVRAQHLLDLDEPHLARLVAAQLLLLPIRIATAVLSTLCFL